MHHQIKKTDFTVKTDNIRAYVINKCNFITNKHNVSKNSHTDIFETTIIKIIYLSQPIIYPA